MKLTMRVHVAAALLAGSAILGAPVRGDDAKDAAMDQLNERNIFFSPDEFVDLVDRDDAENVKIFLQAGQDPNALIGDHPAPLLMCAMRGHTDTARALLEGGALPNVKSADGWTPLHYAAMFGRDELAQLLLDHAADVDARTKYGMTPLHFAVQERHVALVKLLIEHHADASAKAASGVTPVSVAVETEQKDLVKLFEKAGYGGKIRSLREQIKKELSTERHEAAAREADRKRKLKQQLESAGGNRTQ